MRVPRLLLPSLLVLLAALVVPAQASADDETLDAVKHSADGVYLDFSPIGRVELPRLFLTRRADGGLGFDVFGSTTAALASGRYHLSDEFLAEKAAKEAHHEDGEHGSASDQMHSTMPHELEGAHGAAPYDREALTAELIAAHEHLYGKLVPADGGAVVIDFSITRHLLFAILGGTLVCLLFIPMANRYKKGVGRTSAPKGLLQNMLETLVLYVRNEIAVPQLGKKADRYLPYLLTAFFFILTCNLLGLVPFGATATSNISLTIVLAVFTFVLTQIAGTKDYWTHIFWPPGIPTFVKVILVPIEIVGVFTKPFALAIRLFANMTAGHLVILNLIGLIFIFAQLFGPVAGYGVAPVSLAFTLFIYFLELLVAFIQAYVFTILSALFIGMAAAEHDHHHDEDHAHEAALHQSAPLVAHHGSTQAQLVTPEASIAGGVY